MRVQTGPITIGAYWFVLKNTNRDPTLLNIQELLICFEFMPSPGQNHGAPYEPELATVTVGVPGRESIDLQLSPAIAKWAQQVESTLATLGAESATGQMRQLRSNLESNTDTLKTVSLFFLNDPSNAAAILNYYLYAHTIKADYSNPSSPDSLFRLASLAYITHQGGLSPDSPLRSSAASEDTLLYLFTRVALTREVVESQTSEAAYKGDNGLCTQALAELTSLARANDTTTELPESQTSRLKNRLLQLCLANEANSSVLGRLHNEMDNLPDRYISAEISLVEVYQYDTTRSVGNIVKEAKTLTGGQALHATLVNEINPVRSEPATKAWEDATGTASNLALGRPGVSLYCEPSARSELGLRNYYEMMAGLVQEMPRNAALIIFNPDLYLQPLVAWAEKQASGDENSKFKIHLAAQTIFSGGRAVDRYMLPSLLGLPNGSEPTKVTVALNGLAELHRVACAQGTRILFLNLDASHPQFGKLSLNEWWDSNKSKLSIPIFLHDSQAAKHLNSFCHQLNIEPQKLAYLRHQFAAPNSLESPGSGSYLVTRLFQSAVYTLAADPTTGWGKHNSVAIQPEKDWKIWQAIENAFPKFPSPPWRYFCNEIRIQLPFSRPTGKEPLVDLVIYSKDSRDFETPPQAWSPEVDSATRGSPVLNKPAA